MGIFVTEDLGVLISLVLMDVIIVYTIAMTFQEEIAKHIEQTTQYLNTKSNPLFLTTSNRWSGEKGGEEPKSTQLAHAIAARTTSSATIIDISKLNIAACEGNVSTKRGNSCGVKKAVLNDSDKNPSGQHRCWASLNNPDDELWKVSKALLASDCVVFFGSVRWGQMNAYYQKLIERLTWLENRHSTLGEENLLEHIDAGLIIMGHNWNGATVLQTQKQVLGYFGFHVVNDICWNMQFTDASDESNDSYARAAEEFEKAITL